MFSDESGDFTFRDGHNISKYFLIATVTVADCTVGDHLQALQRELAWEGKVLETFHATSDTKTVRKRVFELMADSDIRIDVTALDKRKAQLSLTSNPVQFYKQASFLHFKYVIPRVTTSADDLMVVASALQLKKQKQALHDAVRDVVTQVSPTHRFVTAFLKTNTDPCLQLADYAAWAVQRHLERGDRSSLDIIDSKVRSIFEPFKYGPKTYY
jgi:hypothetical protein